MKSGNDSWRWRNSVFSKLLVQVRLVPGLDSFAAELFVFVAVARQPGGLKPRVRDLSFFEFQFNLGFVFFCVK